MNTGTEQTGETMGRVVLFENNKLSAELACDYLENEGWTVRITNLREDLIRVISSFEPKLLIFALYIAPHESLLQLRGLRFVFPNLAILALSTFMGEVWEAQVRQAGADEYLNKPFDLEELQVAMRQALSVRC
ncbi:response regulator [Leptolyngbya sp. FACHB-261]|uniref:response regulator n=1 Tax=Leptolyngbya sp. FACHB-261 TaxID=2692806 RepID=UPI001685307D|nr:response regulator [Leptolyngbya sp. FACHB-261]MBD2102222.1 response regulator [Leptolyngbya sp. FACHB-261]